MNYMHSIPAKILICIGCLAVFYRVCGKSAVQSALLFAVALLLKDIAANYFGSVGLIVYLFLMAFFLVAIYLVKKKDAGTQGLQAGRTSLVHIQREDILKFIFFILALIGALVLVFAIYKTAGIL